MLENLAGVIDACVDDGRDALARGREALVERQCAFGIERGQLVGGLGERGLGMIQELPGVTRAGIDHRGDAFARGSEALVERLRAIIVKRCELRARIRERGL